MNFKLNGLYIPFLPSYVLSSQQNIKTAIRWFTLSLSVAASYGLYHIIFGITKFENCGQNKRISPHLHRRTNTPATFSSPAALSDAMCILLALGLYLFSMHTKRSKTFGLTAVLLSIPPLLFATVRSNWGGALVTIYLFLVYFRFHGKWIASQYCVADLCA